MIKNIDEKAKELFDSYPYNNPDPKTGKQQIPNWNIQPEHIKDVFRRKIENNE